MTHAPIIVDASVILRIILEEDKTIEKKIKQQSGQFITSPIFFLECLNNIKKGSDLDLKTQELFNSLLKLPIKSEDFSKTDLKEILDMTISNNTTSYDSSYHFLAIKHDGILITCDAKYYAKARHLGHIELWD